MKVKLKLKASELRNKLGIKEIDEAKLIADILAVIPPVVVPLIPLPKTPEQERDDLESLQGDERLDKTAIKGIEELEQKIEAKSIRVARGGSKGFQLFVDGSKKGLTVNTLNLIAGAGIILTYNSAFGRNDVTFSVSSAGLSILTVTGTIDDSNTSFTASSTPQIVVVNGTSYRNGKGCTIVGTAITLDYPVGTGGDIYAIG